MPQAVFLHGRALGEGLKTGGRHQGAGAEEAIEEEVDDDV